MNVAQIMLMEQRYCQRERERERERRLPPTFDDEWIIVEKKEFRLLRLRFKF